MCFREFNYSDSIRNQFNLYGVNTGSWRPVSRSTSPEIRLFPISFDTQLAPRERVKRFWRKICLLIHWTFKSIIKVMRCFFSQSYGIAKKKRVKINRDELHQLFKQSFDYEKIRDHLLTFLHKGALAFNHYDLNSWLMLKEHDPNDCNLLEKTDEIENFPKYSNITPFRKSLLLQCYRLGIIDEMNLDFEPSLEVYDHIVNLYLRRFLSTYPEMNSDEYLPSIKVVALIIAIKISDDRKILNKDVNRCLSPKIDINKLNKMELEFLNAIDWHLL